MENIIVRRFEKEDAIKVKGIIVRNLLEINSKDYGIETMEKLASTYTEEKIFQLSNRSHMYVFIVDNDIVGVGAIAKYYDKINEAILLSIFVNPDYHNNGIGTLIISTLENDEFALQSKRIEIPASITATNFYLKNGYDYKNGIIELDKDKHYRLEKYFDR